MGATVVKDADLPVFAPYHEDGTGADLGGDEVAGGRHLALVPDVDPGVREEVPHLEREHLGVDVDVAMDLGLPHEGGERLAILCILPHRRPSRFDPPERSAEHTTDPGPRRSGGKRGESGSEGTEATDDMKTLDRKLGAILRGDGARTDFIIADAKDADMGGGRPAPGPERDPDGRPLDADRPLAGYLDEIRAITRRGSST